MITIECKERPDAAYFYGRGHAADMVLERGEVVVLVDRRGNRHLLTLTGERERVPKVGVIDTSRIEGAEEGFSLQVGTLGLTVVRPTVLDRVAGIERRAQIVVPRDAALIALYADVKSGDLVVEGGAGSGALSIVLLNLVRPGGRLVTYEVREDHAALASRNVERAGLAPWHELRVGDVSRDVVERDVDALVLDVPEPWEAAELAWKALRPGGRWVSYSPTVGQVERTHEALAEAGFSEARTHETLQRELVVGTGGTRPAFEMLGHTGYVTAARKLSE